MKDPEAASNPKRGTALLVFTMIILAGTIVVIVIPGTLIPSDLPVKVAVIDSGITNDGSLEHRIIASKSFINTSYGYEINDASTEDSNPEGNPHGTYVATIITKESSNSIIINAKVITTENGATEQGITEAIHWAVNEQDCDVINLSLGGEPSNRDLLREVIEWAFQQGVSIIAAAGNNGREGISGSSVESPAVYPEVIGVAGVNDEGKPFGFSARGPLRNRTIKPDISAAGSYTLNGRTVFGTSFAAPIVSAGVCSIIAFCKMNDWLWTPGMIKAALLSSARPLNSEAWEVGTGIIDVEAAQRYLEDAPKSDGLPLVSWMTRELGPYNFERWFINTTTWLEISVCTSNNVTFSVAYQGSASPWINGEETIQVNQTGSFKVRIHVVSDTTEELLLLITLVATGYRYLSAQLDFTASRYFAKVAFDITHTPWWMDSIYGQFRSLYTFLTESGVAIEEISDRREIKKEKLLNFDAVLVLDPCAWDQISNGSDIVTVGSIRYNPKEIIAYEEYWKAGGSLLFAGLSNNSVDVEGVNELISHFNITMNYDRLPTVVMNIEGIANTIEITKMTQHQITMEIDSFDYLGCSLDVTESAYEVAWAVVNVTDSWGFTQEENRTVIAGLEGENEGRILVSGSNFFIDNWALNGLYRSDDNSRLSLQIVYWLIGWF